MSQETESPEDRPTPNTLSNYIVEVAEGKISLHDGPLRESIVEQLNQIYAKSEEKKVLVAFEDQALNSAMYVGIWSAIEHSDRQDLLNTCGYFYSVHAQSVEARDVARFSNVVSSLQPHQLSLSALLVRMDDMHSSCASEYLQPLLQVAQRHGIRVIRAVEEYVEAMEGLR